MGKHSLFQVTFLTCNSEQINIAVNLQWWALQFVDCITRWCFTIKIDCMYWGLQHSLRRCWFTRYLFLLQYIRKRKMLVYCNLRGRFHCRHFAANGKPRCHYKSLQTAVFSIVVNFWLRQIIYFKNVKKFKKK